MFFYLLWALAAVLCGCSAPFIDLSHASPCLTILTFNVRYGTAPDGDNAWPKRRDLFFDTLRPLAALPSSFEDYVNGQPGIVCFQEALAFQVKQTVETLPGYVASYAGRDDGKDMGESCAILYNAARFNLEDSGTFWLSDTPEVVASNTWNAGCTRVCTWVRLTDIWAKVPYECPKFYVFNTHLDHIREEARVKGMTLILSRIAQRSHPEDPVILTGDFNAGEKSETVQLATRSFIDTYRALHPADAPDAEPAGTFNNFKNKTDGEKIDYILVPPHTLVGRAEIIRTTRDGRNASDHFAVMASIILPEPTQLSAPRNR